MSTTSRFSSKSVTPEVRNIREVIDLERRFYILTKVKLSIQLSFDQHAVLVDNLGNQWSL